jgi:hypothetical protein
MKVSCVTLLEFRGVLKHRFGPLAVAICLSFTACHHPVPVTPSASSVSAALAAPPIEAVWIRLPESFVDVPEAIRQAMYRTGLQATAENKQSQWIRAALGGVWEDPTRYRQWHIVANYGADSTGPGTLVVVRALEQFTSYLGAMTGGRANPNGQQASGMTRTVYLNNAAIGDSRAVWVQVEKLALELEDRGGEMMTDLTGKKRRRGAE